MTRRRLLYTIGVLVLLGIAAGTYVRLFAGGPVSFAPGGWLRGTVVSEPVEDWSFAAGQHYAAVESRARFLPYSTESWFMVHGGDLFLLLPNLFGDGLLQRIEEDPAVRIRVDGSVYSGRVTPYDDPDRAAALLLPMLRRIMSVEIEGPTRQAASGLDARVAIYRFESAP